MKKIVLTIMLILVVPNVIAQTTDAPSFSLADTSNNTVTLPGKHDGVEVYLFWATWCPYCKALMPHLQSILVEYGDDVRIYALHIRDDEDPVAFMDENGYEFVLLPEADEVMALYGVKPTPGLFIVDRNGRIRFNLYETIFDDSREPEDLGHRSKASRRAPFWAARIRQEIDQVLVKYTD